MDSEVLDHHSTSIEDSTTLIGYERKPFSFLVKRILDYLGAAGVLVLASPVVALIALLIKLDSAGPVLFCQLRSGRLNKPFTIYKFRTMIMGADRENPEIFKDDPRITRVGRFLRNTSLDELPQLF